MSKAKTDNAYLSVKVALRKQCLPNKKNIRVLDCYHGTGTIWAEVQRVSKKTEIAVDGIDTKKTTNGLHGDNVKTVMSMNLDRYDIIDLDSYGVPAELINVIANKGWSGLVFYTFCQQAQGRLPNILYQVLGIPLSMVRKCPTLFAAKAHEKWIDYLSMYGVDRIRYINKSKGRTRRYYGVFTLTNGVDKNANVD